MDQNYISITGGGGEVKHCEQSFLGLLFYISPTECKVINDTTVTPSIKP